MPNRSGPKMMRLHTVSSPSPPGGAVHRPKHQTVITVSFTDRPIAAADLEKFINTRMLRFRNVVTRRLLTSAPQSSLALPVHNTSTGSSTFLMGLSQKQKCELFMEDATLHVPKANLVLDAGEIDDWVAKRQAGMVSRRCIPKAT